MRDTLTRLTRTKKYRPVGGDAAGQGKTAFAALYARQYRAEYPVGVFWLVRRAPWPPSGVARNPAPLFYP